MSHMRHTHNHMAQKIDKADKIFNITFSNASSDMYCTATNINLLSNDFPDSFTKI